MSDWLYPLSSKKDPNGRPRYWFERADGTFTHDTSVIGLREIISDSPGQEGWVVTMNRTSGRVTPRDRVWFYYGRADGDLGVVAVATVTDMDASNGVSFKWLKGASRKLLGSPVSATRVRRHIERPRVALWPLDRHPALVKELRKAAGI